MTKPNLNEYLSFLNTPGVLDVPRKIVVFHHSDMDGYMAAAGAMRGICEAFYRDNYAISPIHQEMYSKMTFKEVNYGRYKDEDILALIEEGRTDVFVLDFAFPEALSDQIYAKAGFFKTIDHHASSQRAIGDKPYAYFDMNASGARMAFEYFNPEAIIPLAVTLVDNRDLWKKETGMEDQFHESLYTHYNRVKDETPDYNTAFVMDLKCEYLTRDSENNNYAVGKAVRDGSLLINRRNSGIATMCDKKKLMKTTIGGHPAVVFNAPIDQSDACEYVYSQEEYQGYIVGAFNIMSDKMTFSLRKHASLNVDLSMIAEIHYDGGGHPAAAGFAVSLERGLNIIRDKEKWALCWSTTSVIEAMQHEDMKTVSARLSEIPAVLRSRTTCETDLNMLQLLPYIVLRKKDNTYFTYNRPSSGTESRLHGNDSVGLGGHVDTAPVENMPIGLHLGMEALRELQEEVGFYDETIPEKINQKFLSGDFALINVTVRPVDAVHLGMVFIIDIEDEGQLTKIEESEVINPRWSTVEQLQQLPNPETWTSLVAKLVK